jgi:hypothetical protein
MTRSMRRCAIALAACCAAFLAPAPARAEIVATLPPGAGFTDVTVTASGAVWVGRRGPGPKVSGLGTVTPQGVGWTSLPIPPEPLYVGQDRLLPRPDGGIWALLGHRYLVRSIPSGGFARTEAGLGADPGLVVDGDGSLLVGGIGELQRFGLDGSTADVPFKPPGPAKSKAGVTCSVSDGVRATDGRLWLADGACDRLLVRAPDGSLTREAVHAPGTTLPDTPVRLVAAAGGGVWVQARGLPDDVVAGIGGTTGGRRIVLPGDTRPGRMAVTPDGTLWIADASACELLRVRDGIVQRMPAPFLVEGIAAAADGSLWLTSWSKLAHETEASLTASPAGCGARAPRLSFPDRSRRGTISLRALRRAGGLRVRSSEPGTLVGGIDNFELDLEVHVLQGIGAKGTVVRLTRQTLRRLARWVARDGSVKLELDGLVLVDGDGSRTADQPADVRLVP